MSRSAENEKELNNLRSEIAIMRGLDHPNIIKVSPGGAALPALIPRPRVSAHSGCGRFWARAFFEGGTAQLLDSFETHNEFCVVTEYAQVRRPLRSAARVR